MQLLAFVLLTALTAFVAGCSKSVPGTQASENSGPDVVSDLKRLQGVWAIDSFDTDAEFKPTQEALAGARFTIDGDRVAMLERPDRRPENYTFTLATERDPKVMRLTLIGEDGKPKPRRDAESKESELLPWEWLYKFDGEILVLASKTGSHLPPREFKIASEVQERIVPGFTG